MTFDKIPESWKKAVLLPLARLLYVAAGEDMQEAWNQAIILVRGFGPRTEAEFRGAVRVAILSLQANQCFADASDDDTTKSQAIRLRAEGLAFIKATDKAELRLHQLQTIRAQRAQKAAADAESAPVEASEEAPEQASDRAPENAPENAPEKAPERAASLRALNEQARDLAEYARKNNITYAEAWGECARKAVELALDTVPSQP
jgi:hypothetical protein